MPDQLTPRQQKILDVLPRLTREKGFPPSIREIGAAVGLQSVSSVSHQLHELERKGYVRRDPSVPRGLIVVGAVSEGAQTLIDAADQVKHIRENGLVGPTAEHFEQWLRDRAAVS